jgi:hypothetical protein
MLAPLRNEHLQRGEALLIPGSGRPLWELAAELPGKVATVLILEDPVEPSLRGTWATPLIRNARGADIVLGWLRLDAQELRAYAERAAALLRRAELPALPIALLGPREQ